MSTVALYEGLALDRETMAARNAMRARRTESLGAAKVWRDAAEEDAGEAGMWHDTARSLAEQLAKICG